MAKKTKPGRRTLTPRDSDFQIDKFNLDGEWVGHPDLYRRYSECLAEARKDYEEAKNEVRVVRADTELSIRQDPGAYGFEKVTEGTIKSAVELQEAVVIAEQAVIDTRYALGLWEAAVTALDHRKRALSDLVSLHLSDYYSKPVARDGDREAMEDATKQSARRSKRRRTSDD